MRWFFHRQRSKRYEIVLQGLKKTFEEKRGWDFLLELSLKDKKKLEVQDRLAIALFKKLIQPLDSQHLRKKVAYQRFLKVLRKLLKLSRSLTFNEAWHHTLYDFLLEFCVTRYYRTHFFSYGHQLLGSLFAALTFTEGREKSQEHFENYNFMEEAYLIEKSGPLIFLERDMRRFDEFTLKRKFDSHRYNLPSLLYTFALHREEGLQKIKMLRMGSPTHESWFEQPQVVEEFKGLLTYLSRQNKKHLYVNKQKTWGEEGKRSHKIKELEGSFDNFYCVCLPSDGDFYHQSGRFENVEDLEIFKSLFYKMLLEKINSGYYHLPKKWKQKGEFCEQLKETLEEVHKLYFLGKSKLKPLQRQLFIDLSYTHLILFFMQYSGVDSVNITCRDGIDRAGCEQSKLLYYFQIACGVEKELESYKELQYLIHFPVYLAKSRPIVPERREFLYHVFEVFTPEICEAIRNKHQETPLIYEKPLFVKKTYECDKSMGPAGENTHSSFE